MNKLPARTQQQGFTLIELIMVIVILGVLSAFALPRFGDLSGNAQISALEGARASVQSASGIVHAQALVEGTASGGTVTMEGLDIVIQNGYPAGDNADNAAGDDATNGALGISTGYDNTICGAAGLAAADFACTDDDANPAVTTITLATNCFFTYTESNGTLPAIVSAATTTGC